jgi:hypothetical protein
MPRYGTDADAQDIKRLPSRGWSRIFSGVLDKAPAAPFKIPLLNIEPR